MRSAKISAAGVAVFVMDDDPLARQAAVEELNAHPSTRVIGEAALGGSRSGELNTRGADVVIIGTQLESVEALTSRISCLTERQTKIIIFASDDSTTLTASAFAAGAKAVLHKLSGTHQLGSAVQAVVDGHVVVAERSIREMANWIKDSDPKAPCTRLGNLTKTEAAVLRLLCMGKSTEETAVVLGVRSGTVKSHVSHILSKLGVASRAQAVSLACRAGLLEGDRA